MTLKMKLENLDGLSEEIAKLYKEVDGVYVLDVEAHHEKNANRDKSNMVPISRLNQEIERRKQAEQGLEQIANQMIETVPEEKRELIPATLAPSAKIGWIQKAVKMGVFEEKQTESIDSKRPGDQKPTDFKDMSPQAIMATGYKTK